jgi:hypothetical protein
MSMKRPLSAAVVVLPLALAPVVVVGEPLERRLGSTVDLDVMEAHPGTIRLVVRSPYPGRPFRVRTPGPTGVPFTLASGTTDGRGIGTVTITLRDDERVVNLNGTFSAEVDLPAGLPAASLPSLLRVGRAPAGTSGGLVLEGSDLGVPADLEPVVAAAGDIDLDGDSDLLIAGSSGGAGRLILLRNDGGGQAAGDPDAVPGPWGASAPRVVVLSDVDGDGDLDAFAGAGESEPSNTLLVNDGGGRFARRDLPGRPEGTRTNAALFADLDGDGDADLFVANGITGSHGVEAVPQVSQLLLNDGTGTFAPSPAIGDQDLPASILRAAAAGDVDLDGDLDLLIAGAGEHLLLVNDGSAAFEDGSTRLPLSADSTYGAALSDVDGDGDLDILYASAAFSPVVQTLLLNLGGLQGGEMGTFEPGAFPMIAAGQSPVRLGLQTADVDVDGDADLLFAVHELGADERPDLYINQGGSQGGVRGEFRRDASLPLASGVYQSLPLADMDGDGDLDLVALPGGNALERRLYRNQVFSHPDAPLGFLRGEVNGDFTMNISDPIDLLGHLFSGTDAPPCLLAADINDDAQVDLSDAIGILNHLFSGGAEPRAPYPAFGDDPTPDGPGGPGCDWVTVFEGVEASQ